MGRGKRETGSSWFVMDGNGRGHNRVTCFPRRPACKQRCEALQDGQVAAVRGGGQGSSRKKLSPEIGNV